MNPKKQTNKLSEQDVDEILKLYYETNLTTTEIGKRFNCDRGVIEYYRKKKGLPQRPSYQGKKTTYYFSMESFVKDSIDKYYWLGFLAADGYINKKQTSIQLHLKSADVKHLEKFKKFAKTNAKINFMMTNHNHGSAYIRINSKELGLYLEQYNLVSHKSKDYEIPVDKIPAEYRSHFLRGMFDGDGSISYTRRGQVTFAFCSGSLKCIEQIKTWLGLDNAITFSSGAYKLAVTGNHKAPAIFDQIYKYSSERNRLDRKYERYLDIEETLE